MFLLRIFFTIGVCYLFTNGFFLKHFTIPKIDKKAQITYTPEKYELEEQNILTNINGFFGVIGPDIRHENITSLFDLFMCNGNIQGIFLQNGNITFIKHYIQTEKLLFENKYGEIPNNMLIQTLCFFLHKLKLAPDLLNVANTAFMKIDNQLFALFERDTPYLLDLNFQKKTIETIKKINILGIQHFSAHSKVVTRQKSKQIETIDYDVFKNNVV